jgi:hypothetical protein
MGRRYATIPNRVLWLDGFFPLSLLLLPARTRSRLDTIHLHRFLPPLLVQCCCFLHVQHWLAIRDEVDRLSTGADGFGCLLVQKMILVWTNNIRDKWVGCSPLEVVGTFELDECNTIAIQVLITPSRETLLELSGIVELYVPDQRSASPGCASISGVLERAEVPPVGFSFGRVNAPACNGQLHTVMPKPQSRDRGRWSSTWRTPR